MHPGHSPMARRTAAEVSDIVGRQPFPADSSDVSVGKPQVTFLRNAPDSAAVDTVMAHATVDDQLTVVGREWYWLPTGGMSQSELDVRAIERILGRGTTRTVNTVIRLHAKYLSGPAY